jgi:hypothetical protein
VFASVLSGEGVLRMRYAILYYHDEDAVAAWTPIEEATVKSRLKEVLRGVAAEGQLSLAAHLMPTTVATTVRRHAGLAMVLDGPFQETKEQLLGFLVIEADCLNDAVEVASNLGLANPTGTYEIRPIAVFTS